MGYSFVPAGSIAVAQFGTQFRNLSKIGEEYHEIKSKSKSKFKFPIRKYHLCQCNQSTDKWCEVAIFIERKHTKKNPTKMHEEHTTQKNWQRENAQVIPEYDVQFILNTKSIFYFPLFLFVCVCVCLCFCFKQGIVKLLWNTFGKEHTHNHTHMHTCIENGF